MASRAMVTTGGDLTRFEGDAEEPGNEEKMLAGARAIVGRLENLAREQMGMKTFIETRWLEDLRQYYGYYEAVTDQRLKDAKRSRAFIKLTRHKTNGWAARLNDLLFPTDERNWAIEPTPVPTLVKAAKEAQAQAAAAVDQANTTADQAEQPGQDPATAAKLHQRARQSVDLAQSFAQAATQSEQEMEEAKKRCDRMQTVILDQLEESHYPAQCRDVIESACKIGTGILKGPMTSNRLRSEWRKNETYGHWETVAVPDPQPDYTWVDPWHFFPDMAARTIQEAEFTFERSLPTRRDLRKHAKKLGFNKAAVRRLLEQGPGDISGTDLTFLQNLRDLTKEGQGIKGRYVMWEYHGSLECEDVVCLLSSIGRADLAQRYEETRDPLDDYRVIIHFCGNEVLKIAEEYPLDSGESLYSIFNFEKGESSVFGIGIPYIMRDSQKALNGAWRMMMDNAGLSVGPQVVIDKNSIVPQDNDWGIRPLKVWLKSSTALHSANNKPFEIFNIPSNQQQLGGIIELAMKFADEETSLPLLAQGEQGNASNTLGGMSMLFNSANVMFRRVVKSFDDDLTEPTIRRGFDWNMQFHPDETIKGDMKITARGTSVLLVREIQSVHMMNITQNWTQHPVLKYYVKTYDTAAKSLQTLMIKPDDILRSEDDAKKLMDADAKAMQGAGNDNGAAALAASREKVAQIDADSREKVAVMTRDTRMAELALQEKTSLADIQSKFGIKQAEISSTERRHAADIGLEERRAAREAEAGRDPAAVEGKGIG